MTAYAASYGMPWNRLVKVGLAARLGPNRSLTMNMQVRGLTHGRESAMTVVRRPFSDLLDADRSRET
jgi:hypothetical protein